MSFRFRRSVGLGKGARLNLSKSGVGLRIGGRGAGVSIGPSGKRVSAGLPGTGLSYSAAIGKRKASAPASDESRGSSKAAWVAVIIAAVFAAGLLLLLPRI